MTVVRFETRTAQPSAIADRVLAEALDDPAETSIPMPFSALVDRAQAAWEELTNKAGMRSEACRWEFSEQQNAALTQASNVADVALGAVLLHQPRSWPEFGRKACVLVEAVWAEGYQPDVAKALRADVERLEGADHGALDLSARIEALKDEQELAEQADAVARHAAAALIPDRPDELYVTCGDVQRFGLGGQTVGRAFSQLQIEELLQLLPGYETSASRFPDSEPLRSGLARLRSILQNQAAFELYRESPTYRAAAAEATRAGDALNLIWDRRSRLEEELLRLPVTTLAGLAAKARLEPLLELYEEDTWRAEVRRVISDDLQLLAGRQ